MLKMASSPARPENEAREGSRSNTFAVVPFARALTMSACWSRYTLSSGSTQVTVRVPLPAGSRSSVTMVLAAPQLPLMNCGGDVVKFRVGA